MRAPIAPASSPLRSVLRQPISHRLRFCRHRSSTSDKTSSSSTVGKHRDEAEEAIPVAGTVAPLPLWQRLGPLTTAARAYARVQKRRPWGTQLVSALVIYFIADISAQNVGDGPFDPHRTARSLIIGGIAAIPGYTWFLFLSHHFNYSSHILSLAVKIVVNQMVFTPTFNTFYFGSQALLQGCSPAGVVDRIVNTVPHSIAASCRFWPIVTAFSFTFIPIQYRSVFSMVIAIGWQTYLALLNRRAERRAKLEASGQLKALEGVDGRKC